MSEELNRRLHLAANSASFDGRPGDAFLMREAAHALESRAPVAAVGAEPVPVVEDGLIGFLTVDFRGRYDFKIKNPPACGVHPLYSAQHVYSLLAAPAPATVAPSSNLYGPGSATSPAAAHMLATGAFPATVATEAVAQDMVPRLLLQAAIDTNEQLRNELADALAEKAVAQGGGVDADKVMALVEEYGEQCEAAGYLDRSGSQDASKKLHESAYQTAVKIRALLAAPAASPAAQQEPR